MKIQWLQNKKAIKGLMLFTITALTAFMVSSCVFAFGGEGHFEKVDYGSKPFESAEPVKIKSGKVIFPPNHIFDPETNKITEVKDKTFFDGILLNDGRIFHAEAILEHPCESMIEIIDLSHGKVISGTSQNKIRKMLRDGGVEIPKDYRYWDVKDKEKFFMPYLKKNSELYDEYKEALDLYEKSMYGIISDPETGKFEYTKGKMNVRRNNAYKFLLDDGRIILIGGWIASKDGFGSGTARQIEIFDPKSGEFTLIKNEGNFKYSIHDVFKIDDKKLFLMNGNDYLFYNLDNNSFSKKEPFLPGWDWEIKTHLKDGNLLVYARNFNKNFFDEIQNKEELLREYKNFTSGVRKWNLNIILIYNTNNNIFKYAGQMNTPRGRIGDFNSTLLKDGRALTFGGRRGEDINGHAYITNTAEVFDPKTGKSKKTENMNYARFSTAKAIALDDGRALLYRYPSSIGGAVKIDQIELYIPKGWKK